MQIQSEPQTLEKIFHGVSTRYAVPHYQRDYTWNSEQWEELWSDVATAHDQEQEYFLGSFVLNTENLESSGALEIVDGQQRLTTFTILFAVIRDIAAHFQQEPQREPYAAMASDQAKNVIKAKRTEGLTSQLIVHLSEPDNYFLQLNDKDQPIFRAKIQAESGPLLTREELKTYKSESRLVKCKKFFTRKIIESFLSRADGFDALEKFVTFTVTKLTLLKIAVQSDNDAYLLFETLNDRGLDLSIADLVKNRLLLGCGSDEEKKTRVLQKWNELITRLGASKFQPHDFLRFYWCALEETCTKKELYRHIRTKLSNGDGEALLDAWLESSEFFTEITARDLRFPAPSLSLGTQLCSYAELNSQGYSVHIPLFLYLHRNRPELLAEIAEPATSYLFRVITVGGFSASRAESRFEKVLDAIKLSETNQSILRLFGEDPEASDEKFVERIKTQRFEDNKSAKYFLSKWHLKECGEGHPINHDIHLEHVLPQKTDSWAKFDPKAQPREDWVYAIGNMTLLEQALNKSIQASDFGKKVKRYQQRTSGDSRGSAIPMTYKIAAEHKSTNRDWDSSWIAERSEKFGNGAPMKWPLPASPSVSNESDGDAPAQ